MSRPGVFVAPPGHLLDGHTVQHCTRMSRGSETLTEAEEIEALREALRDDREKWSFDLCVYVARRCLEENYPPDIFTGESGDPGPRLVVALRDVLRGESDY